MTTTFWSKTPAFSPLIALVKHHHHHHHPRSNTYAQYQCLGRSPPFVHCWFGSNNSTLDRYLSFWSIPPATSKICFSKKQSGKLKFSLRPRSHLEILRWCRRASTLLQEGQAESPGSCLLSRTWEIGRGEEILDPHLSTLPWFCFDVTWFDSTCCPPITTNPPW